MGGSFFSTGRILGNLVAPGAWDIYQGIKTGNPANFFTGGLYDAYKDLTTTKPTIVPTLQGATPTAATTSANLQAQMAQQDEDERQKRAQLQQQVLGQQTTLGNTDNIAGS